MSNSRPDSASFCHDIDKFLLRFASWFVTSSNFLDVKYFTSKSYYSLVDYATEETLIPFGEESKLSADSEGMYFKLYMKGLQPERYYRVLFKHKNAVGTTIYDDNHYFKVVR